jgi:serine/threonine-protein kinase
MPSSSSARLRPFQPVPFGRYTLLAPLSVGGMGEIFLARLEGPNGFEKLCVIKKILPELAADPDFVSRFTNEARILVKLSHGSIAQVLEMGLHEGAPYIALEFVDGKDLRKVATRLKERGQRFPIPVALYVMTRMLDALGYAHRKRDDQDRELQLVHRDVSPQNVLLSYEGEVKVIDFGLAKSSLSTAKTNPAVVLGKFLYMSPEQARHQRVDRRSDLYSAGLFLYELIAGTNPLEASAAGDLLAQVAAPSFTPLREVAPWCPQGLSDAVMKALERDPADRFQTAEAFRAKVMGALLELDPTAGPESAAAFMRELFAAEYAQERKRVGAARDQLRMGPRQVESAGTRRTAVELPAVRLEDVLPQAGGPEAAASSEAVSPPDRGGPPSETMPMSAESVAHLVVAAASPAPASAPVAPGALRASPAPTSPTIPVSAEPVTARPPTPAMPATTAQVAGRPPAPTSPTMPATAAQVAGRPPAPTSPTMPVPAEPVTARPPAPASPTMPVSAAQLAGRPPSPTSPTMPVPAEPVTARPPAPMMPVSAAQVAGRSPAPTSPSVPVSSTPVRASSASPTVQGTPSPEGQSAPPAATLTMPATAAQAAPRPSAPTSPAMPGPGAVSARPPPLPSTTDLTSPEATASVATPSPGAPPNAAAGSTPPDSTQEPSPEGAPLSVGAEPTRPGIPSPLLDDPAFATGHSPFDEPTRPRAVAPAAFARARQAASANTAAIEPTRPGFPSPLLEDTTPGVRSPIAPEPTIPGMTSPLFGTQAATPGAQSPTREIAIAIPDGARPTPPPMPSVGVELDELLAGAQASVTPSQEISPTKSTAPLEFVDRGIHAPVMPSPMGASAPTLPDMRAAQPDEAPLVMGEVLPEEEPPPQARPTAATARPRRAAPPSPAPTPPPVQEPAQRTFSEPTLPLPQPGPTTDERIPTQELRKGGARKLGWLAPVTTIVLLVLAGFFAHGFYQAGLFDGMLSGLSPELRARLGVHPIEGAPEVVAPRPKPIAAKVAVTSPPVATARAALPQAPAPSEASAASEPGDRSSAEAASVPTEPDSAPAANRQRATPPKGNEDDLSLLRALPTGRPVRHRAPPKRLSPLDREWRSVRAEFRRLEADSPCESAGMAMLCTRFRALEASMTEPHEGDDARLLERVKDLRRVIARKAGQ